MTICVACFGAQTHAQWVDGFKNPAEARRFGTRRGEAARPPSTRPEMNRQPAAPVNCFEQAKVRTFLTDEQAARLCKCQRSARNVDCFLDAKARTFLEDDDAVRLCAGNGFYSDLNCID